MGYLLCGDYYNMLDKIDDESLDAWFDSASLMYNDFQKTKNIIEKACKKLKNGGKFLSITPKFETYGFYDDDKLGYHLCEPVQGWYANTGTIRYATLEDISSLYFGENFRVTSIYKKIIKNEIGHMLDLFIIEGEKC